MNLSLFTDTAMDDEASVNDFMLANYLAHSNVAGALLSAGKPITETPLLDMDISDPAWLQNHNTLHEQEYSLLGLIGLPELLSVDMNNEQAYRDWMQGHAQAHEQVNLALGLS